jgi:hypothetical protein
MGEYAKAKYAFGFCDKTGFRYPLKDLVFEYRNGIKTGLKVGRDVVDPDHPQNFLGRYRIFDPQSLMDARPDRFTESVTFKYPAFDATTLEPFGSPEALRIQSGNVTVVT